MADGLCWLEDEKGSKVRIQIGQTVIGRAILGLNDKKVSREQVKLLLSPEGKLSVTLLGTTNPSSVKKEGHTNAKVLNFGEVVELEEGDTLCMLRNGEFPYVVRFQNSHKLKKKGSTSSDSSFISENEQLRRKRSVIENPDTVSPAQPQTKKQKATNGSAVLRDLDEQPPGTQQQQQQQAHNPKANDNANPTDKPACQYGANCYRKNPQHLADYYHPPAEGEDHVDVATASNNSHPTKPASKSQLDLTFHDDAIHATSDNDIDFKPQIAQKPVQTKGGAHKNDVPSSAPAALPNANKNSKEQKSAAASNWPSSAPSTTTTTTTTTTSTKSSKQQMDAMGTVSGGGGGGVALKGVTIEEIKSQLSYLKGDRFSKCLAFPSLSTSSHSKFPADVASQIACEVIGEFLKAKKDKGIRLYLVESDESVLDEFVKHWDFSSDARFKVVDNNPITKLRIASFESRFIVAEISWRWKLSNHELLEANEQAVTFQQQRLYPSPAAKGNAYPIPLPPESELRSEQGVDVLLFVCSPNMNPKKPDPITDLQQAKELLRKSYASMLNTWYQLIT